MRLPVRKLLRFSVRELLLFVTIIVLAVCLWIANDDRQKLEVENQRLRDEAGHLTVADPKKVHAIEIPVTGDFRWKWRLHLPSDRDLWLFVGSGDVPRKGPLHKSASVSKMRLGAYSDPERTLEVSVQKNSHGQYCVAARCGLVESTTASFAPDSLPPWLTGEAMIGETIAGSGQTVSVARGEPLVLLRLYSVRRKGESGGGLMIWIEEDSRKR